MVDGQKPQTLLETLNVTNQDLYSNIYAIFPVLITMPVSSASSERSFSAMRRVNNCLRATMDLLGALSGPQTPRRKLCLHFILYLATPLMNIKTFLFLLVHIQNCKGEEVTSCITF